MKGFIYKFVNKINSKVYIGQTRQNIKSRYSQHIRASKKDRGHILHKAISKYGIENFEFTVVEEIELDDKKELIDKLNDLEISYILEYNCLTPNGYNIQKGGRVTDIKFNYEKEAELYNITYLLKESIYDNGIIYKDLPEYCIKSRKSLTDAYNDLMFCFNKDFHWENTNIIFNGTCYPENSTIQQILDRKAFRYIPWPIKD